MEISERLLKLRKERGLSQEDLANELGVSRQTVSKWETGESTPDFDKIIPLCDYYGITSDELLTGEKDIVVANEEDKRKKYAANIAISVGMYIGSVIIIILFGGLLNMPIVGVCLFFLVIAIATGLIIYNAIVNKTEKKEKREKNSIEDQICGIVGLLGTVIYFLVSFTTGAWHLTWIIFIVMGICEEIVKLIFNVKEQNKKAGEENE